MTDPASRRTHDGFGDDGAGLTAPIALIGLKAYFSHARTLAWFNGLTRLVAHGRAEGLSLVVIPSVTSLATLAPAARQAGIRLAAQDCSLFPAGPWTGELPASLVAEVGASIAEIGHAERRRHFHETDEVVAAKVRAAVAAGLMPMVCVGEPTRMRPQDAAAEVVRQLSAALAGTAPTMPLLIAYEPMWAIGAPRPAPPSHILEVAQQIRGWTDGRPGARLLYGGTAGPGLYRELAGVVDGLALGRRAHDLTALGAVLDEMRGVDAVTTTETKER